jgi:hypothetical protein
MALFDLAFVDSVLNQIHAHQIRLSQALGLNTSELPANSPLRDNLLLLVEVANGLKMRSHASTQELEALASAIKHVQACLLGSSFPSALHIPEELWSQPIGVLLSRASWWLHGEDLISISNAAALAFGSNTQSNRMRIIRAINNGLLDWLPDPSVANPQQNKRVLRPQVERLRDMRSLPQ